MHKIVETVKYFLDRRFSTIAGTLVYFFLMSIAPFLLWLSLVFGQVDVSGFLNMRLLQNVTPVLRYLKSSAESAADAAINGATGEVGIIFLATSLYSSTNFFYHLRRSGEIIYKVDKIKGGIKIRLVSLLLICATIFIIALTASVSIIGSELLSKVMPTVISDAISLVFTVALIFLAAVALNLFACPYKLKLRDAVHGSLLTTALWLILGVGFAIYSKFSSPEKLYGKIAALIIFLLWCYVMMCCFVVGMIENGRYISRSEPIKKF